MRRAARRVGCALAVATAAALLARPLAAQDIEALSAVRGIPLPAAYFERLRANPNAFELPNGLFRVTPGGPQPAALVEGTARLPVILALFADSRAPHITREEVNAALFAGPAAAGTITQFYEEISGGRFRVTGDVLPWVRTQVTMAQAVGDSYGLGGTARMRDYLIQALTAADEHVDFAQYDNDGPDRIPNSGDDDGIVDAVTFEFLEIGASCGGPAIWPHRSSIGNWNGGRPYFSSDMARDGVPIMVSGYIIQGVTDCSGQTVQTAATISHEYGHVLGFPDFYHPTSGPLPENRRWVLGCWEVMAAGSWGCGPVTSRVSFGPTHMMAAQKEAMGWLQYDRVVGEVWDREYVLDPVQTSQRALLIPLDSDGFESLVLEYRTRTGFDRDLPAEGVLISHLDRRGSLRPQTGFRYSNRLVEADGNDGLIRVHAQGGNRGEAGDAFGANGSVGKLNAVTRPALLLNATLQPIPLAIHSITLSGGKARVRLSTGRTPRVIPPAAPVTGSLARPIATAVRIAGGLMPYAVIGVSGAPEGVDPVAEGDEVVMRGAPRKTGAFQMAVSLIDSFGTYFDMLVPMQVQSFVVEQGRLLQSFLGTEDQPLFAEEKGYLDTLGNENGAFDVGDVRAWLLRE